MKATYLSENYALYSKLLEKYNKAKEEFLHLISGKMPELYFAFDTRFTLSSSMDVSFNKNEIKSKSARACYIRLVKITDIWVTYEALLRIVYEQQYFRDINAKSTAIKDKEGSFIFELDDILTNCNNQLKFNCLNTERNIIKLQGYLSFLSQNSSTAQVAVVNNALYSLKSRIPFKIQEIIGLILGIRNMFVNKGNTSLAHIKNLKLTKSLFEILYDFITLASLKIATKLINNKIEEITK